MSIKKKKSLSDAKELELKIINNSLDAQIHIYNFVQNKSYKKLGYSSFKKWASEKKEELGLSYDSLNNYYNTARVTSKIFSKKEIGCFSPYSLKPLLKLSDEELKKFKSKLKLKLKITEPVKGSLTRKMVLEILSNSKISSKNELKEVADNLSAVLDDDLDDDISKVVNQTPAYHELKKDISKSIHQEASGSIVKDLSVTLCKKLSKKRRKRLSKKLVATLH